MKIHSKLFLFVLLIFLQFQVSAQNKTIIHAGKLLATPGEGVTTNQTLVVENGVITSIKPGFLTPDQLGISGDNVEVIDLREKFVMPGLIDMHVHITSERDPNRNPHEWTTLNDQDAAFAAIPYLEATLDAGFTTVRDLGSDQENINAIKRAIQKKILEGPRIVAGGGVGVTGGHGDFHGYRSEITEARGPNVGICNGADDCARAVRARVKQDADLIKIAATGGVLSNTAAGVGQQISDDELASIVKTSRSLGRKVAAHAHAADGINAALKAGVNSIEHGSFLDDESVILFKKNNAYLVPTLLAGVHMSEEMEVNDQIPPAIVAKIKQVVPAVEASFKRALKGNVNIAFGTDSGVSKHGTNAREFQLMVKYGMKPEEAIKAATVNAAQLLDMYDRIGSLKEGKLADIVAVDGDPLKDINSLMDVDFVMKNGTVYKMEE